jgi:hypothetical protein
MPRRKTKGNIHVFQPGEVIPGIGKIETNHCGLPWPSGIDFTLYGAVMVNSFPRDAISGKLLTEEEQEIRKDNDKFDYFESGIVDHWEYEDEEELEK